MVLTPRHAAENAPTVGFAVIYRWKLHAGKEDDFVSTWTRVSELLYLHHGSLGSRLHRGPDGIWYSYAQWPDAETRQRAFAAGPLDAAASALQKTCVAEYLPEIILQPVSDVMAMPVANQPGRQQ